MTTVYQTNTQNCAKLNRNQHIEWKTKIIDTPFSRKLNSRWLALQLPQRRVKWITVGTKRGCKKGTWDTINNRRPNMASIAATLLQFHYYRRDYCRRVRETYRKRIILVVVAIDVAFWQNGNWRVTGKAQRMMQMILIRANYISTDNNRSIRSFIRK